MLARRARQLGYSHLGITDAADLGGIARFAVDAMAAAKDPECARANEHDSGDCPICQRPVRPIVGAELNVDGRPAAFIARDASGFNNLAALVTLARMGEWDAWEKSAQGKKRGRPNVTFEQLAARSAGLHALTGPASGALASRIVAGDECGAKQTLDRWCEVFSGRPSLHPG